MLLPHFSDLVQACRDMFGLNTSVPPHLYTHFQFLFKLVLRLLKLFFL